MTNALLKSINARETYSENKPFFFNENDFSGSMKRLIIAVNNHKPSEEQEYAFQYGLAIMEGSKNEIKKGTNLYKLIQAQCYNFVSESESDKFVLHPDFRINIV